jgi:hypothetical protein
MGWTPGMIEQIPISVNVRTVHSRKLAAVPCEVPSGAVGAAWGPALGKVWPFIRTQPSLWINAHNIFLYHRVIQRHSRSSGRRPGRRV